MRAIDIARVAHEVNRAYCAGISEVPPQPSWEDAPPLIRNSVIAGVEKHLDNRNITPEQSHAEWCAYKLAEGWRFGEVKNLALREHPNLVPYDQLPQAQRVKDLLFTAVIHSLT